MAELTPGSARMLDSGMRSRRFPASLDTMMRFPSRSSESGMTAQSDSGSDETTLS